MPNGVLSGYRAVQQKQREKKPRTSITIEPRIPEEDEQPHYAMPPVEMREKRMLTNTQKERKRLQRI